LRHYGLPHPFAAGDRAAVHVALARELGGAGEDLPQRVGSAPDVERVREQRGRLEQVQPGDDRRRREVAPADRADAGERLRP